MRSSLPVCRLGLLLVLSLPAAGCVSEGPELPLTSRSIAPDSADDAWWAAPPIGSAVSVRDAESGRTLPLDELLDRLARADVVFLGEVHDDETSHRTQLAVLEGLLERRPDDVVLALEMFERDVQPVLDDYLAGRVSEEEFLARSRPWGNYRTAYRPLVEAARRAGRPVLASNFPRPLIQSVASEGWEAAVGALEGAARRQAPAELFPNPKDYWRRVDNAVRGHLEMMGPPPEPDDPRLTSTQSLWDNSMGETCARALAESPGAIVLHVNGGFHSAYGQGTVHQLRLRAPRADVVTVALVPTTDPTVAELSGRPAGDYVVFCEERASDVRDGQHSVSVSTALRYRLELPPAATDQVPAPLLVWLGDDGLDAQDGLELWRERLGSVSALAVVEPAYRELAPDRSSGGRWFWPDTFDTDVGAATGGLERIVGYLLRRYPLDPARVCLAGEGTGATIVAAATMLSPRLRTAAVAVRPRDYRRLHDLPLPLPGYRDEGPWSEKSLRVLAGGGAEEFWTGELEAYRGVGLDAALREPTDDPWRVEGEAEALVREGLRLAPPDAEPADPEPAAETRYVRATHGSARGRFWERLLALSADAAVLPAGADVPPGAREIATSLSPEDVAAEGALPPCPGPFGGTTVLVLPEDTPSGEVEGWLALEAEDPLQARSRFHRLRIAVPGDPERDVAPLLEKLEAERRTNVLLVPALFCADAGTMARLAEATAPLADRLTLHWRPGLGDRLAR